jgi:hypothetical protein
MWTQSFKLRNPIHTTSVHASSLFLTYNDNCYSTLCPTDFATAVCITAPLSAAELLLLLLVLFVYCLRVSSWLWNSPIFWVTILVRRLDRALSQCPSCVACWWRFSTRSFDQLYVYMTICNTNPVNTWIHSKGLQRILTSWLHYSLWCVTAIALQYMGTCWFG